MTIRTMIIIRARISFSCIEEQEKQSVNVDSSIMTGTTVPKTWTHYMTWSNFHYGDLRMKVN